jgi:hypothetical protein
MPEDAPGNPGAVEWPHPDTAYFTVREMQSKLHRWAGDDSSRRFGDLFNLLCSPAFRSAPPLGHQQRLEAALAVTGHLDRHRADRGLHFLC